MLLVDAAPTTGFTGSAAEPMNMLARLEDAGADEVRLIPTSCDLDQLHHVAQLVA